MTSDQPPKAVQAIPEAAAGTDYHMEAYKLLADMVQTEESNFWNRNQMFLTLNSGLVVILLGILTLLGNVGSTTPPAATPQSVPGPTDGPQGLITSKQKDHRPPGSKPGFDPGILVVPLVATCFMGAFLCFLWTGLVMRSEGMNDLLVAHMKDLEQNHLPQIDNMRKYDALFDKHENWWLGDTQEVAFTSEKVKLSWWGSLFRLYHVWLLIALAFILLWIIFGVATILYFN